MSQALAARNQLGAITRHHPDDEDKITAARQQLAVAKISEYVRKVVDQAPPLTREQLDSLAVLFRGAA